MNKPFTSDKLCEAAGRSGTPLFVYSQEYLKTRAAELAGYKMPYGFTARYAVKANSHPEVIRIFADAGVAFDASSSYEADMLLKLGIDGKKISLSSQQPAHNLAELLESKVGYIATSMHQLKLFSETARPGSSLGLRVNPGLGAGHNNRTTTGGANSSFGLWNAYLPDALRFAEENELVIDKLHLHIGSGADPNMWAQVMDTALDIVGQMPQVGTLDIGGGFKIRRFSDEHEADLDTIMEIFEEKLTEFKAVSGRELHLEIEPGTWAVGHAGVLISEIVDIVDTGEDGHTFLRLNTGMNDFIRPSMYGAQHEIEVLGGSEEYADYVVVGHNCETGDILTPANGDPEGLEPRRLQKAEIGGLVAIYDTGAYCASMSAKGYNSFPDAKETVI